MSRLLITGDRSSRFQAEIEKALRDNKPDLVIHGGCSGVDTEAGEQSGRLEIPCMRVPAKWRTAVPYKAQGMIRNTLMITLGAPTLVLAFHDDILSSKGTWDMIQKSVKVGIETCLYSRGKWRNVTQQAIKNICKKRKEIENG